MRAPLPHADAENPAPVQGKPPRDLGKPITRAVALVLLVLLFVYGYRQQIATVKPEVAPPPRAPVTSFAFPGETAPPAATTPPSAESAPRPVETAPRR